MNPTRTTNRIHFEDMDPLRFEDLALAMVYRASRWIEINHHGRSGSDQGIDIHATEEIENNTTRTWFIQCKRYKKISKNELTKVITEATKREGQGPDILLLVLACDVSKTAYDHFIDQAKKANINRAVIWSASILETKLYSEHHDLLFAYFGISLSAEKRNRIATVKRNIRMKEKMWRDFIAKSYDPNETLKRPYKKFSSSEIIIHSIDDNFYPEPDPNAIGISPWFKVEPYNFYHNGLEVTLSIEKAIFSEGNEWDIVRYNEKPRKEKYLEANVFVIGRIPFENIIDYDVSGDEYYNSPHIYCDFKNGGQPYEEIVYSLVSRETDDGYKYDKRLDNSLRRKLP